MKVISLIYHKLCERIVHYAEYYRLQQYRQYLGYCAKDAIFKLPDVCSCPEKIFLEDNTSIFENSKFIISPLGEKGKFIMKQYSNAAQGLTVITGNHNRHVGEPSIFAADSHKYDTDLDVIVEEDVSIGANVTLLAGCRVGRGATIGAGSVCSAKIPPYAVVIGNPAQIVGFVFTPEEIIEHEKTLYPEEERLPLAKLEKNYKKYYLDQMQHIAGYMSLNMLPNV